MFLCTGYINVPPDATMAILYLAMHFDVKDLVKSLLVEVPRSENEHLWIVLLRVFNDPDNRKDIEYAKELMRQNPRFLVNFNNDTEICQSFLKLESLAEVERFLKVLGEVLTDNGRFEMTKNYRYLIDTLFRFYICKKKLPVKEYSISRINKLLGDNIAEEAKVFEEGDLPQLLREVKQKEQKVKELEE